MNVSKLAWRNLWRRRRRTLITAFSIAFGVVLAVTATGVGDYSYSNMINSSAEMGLGHVTVAALGYNQTPALDKKISGSGQVRESILPLPEVEAAFVRIAGQGMFSSANKTVGGGFLAIDPQQESSENNVFIRSISKGGLFSSPDSKQVVVGSRLAKKLNLEVGKKLVYTSTDSNGEIVSDIARVSGVFKTGVKEVDAAMVLFPINTVRRALGYQGDESSYVAILIKDQRHAFAVRRQIAGLVDSPQREVLVWQETQPDIAGFVALDRGSNYIIQLLIGLLIAAGILNTLLMSVLERTREFGVMMAVGMSPSSLFQMVLLESLWMALVGLFLGVLITVPWFYYLATTGIDFSGALGEDYSAGGVLVDPVMKIRLYKESAIGILLGVFGLTLFSGVYPAWRAGRVPPVESLKAM